MGAGADSEAGLRLVMLGPPGSGKGTQAERLAGRWDVPAISTGEMLREAVAAGSELGGRVGAIMDSGQLVDDETMAAVVENRLAAPDAARGFILDGYPRTLDQAATLERILAGRSQVLQAVLALEVAEDVLIERALARRRADDREEVIKARLDVYREKTAPLLDYYERRDLVLRIDGDQMIEDVTKAALQALAVEA